MQISTTYTAGQKGKVQMATVTWNTVYQMKMHTSTTLKVDLSPAGGVHEPTTICSSFSYYNVMTIVTRCVGCCTAQSKGGATVAGDKLPCGKKPWADPDIRGPESADDELGECERERKRRRREGKCERENKKGEAQTVALFTVKFSQYRCRYIEINTLTMSIPKAVLINE